MKRKKLLIGAGVLVLAAALAYANFAFKRNSGKTVNAELVKARDLEAIVSASGKIQAKRTVNISADTSGRITQLSVEEGDRVKLGQFLMQIDPRNLRSMVESNEASLAVTRSTLEQLRVQILQSRENLSLARVTVQRQRDLWAQQLTTKESVDKAETDLRVRESELRAAEQNLSTQQARIRQEQAGVANARYNLSKVRIEAPIDGIITKRNVEEGETAVVGTMNNAGTVLLVLADMSIIEAEVEVDETDIPTVKIGQIAKITIDAMPGKTFAGKVTEVGSSPINQTTASSTANTSAGTQATNFKVTVTIDGQIPDVRPGFTCSASITTATRSKALSVPIQAMAVRELTYDQAGSIIRPKIDDKKRRPSSTGSGTASAEELQPGQSRKEQEGVFIIRDAHALFLPVQTGIAGDKYFEVLGGLKAGDQVITGPFNSVRDLQDGDQVKVDVTSKAGGTAATTAAQKS
jgi:HlyD family secretion protein